MPFTFSRSFTDTTSDHYLKQSIPMCEIRINQIQARNPNLINSLDR